MGKGNDPNCASVAAAFLPADDSGVVVLDSGPVSLTDLPGGLADDEDLVRQIEARYGGDPEQFRFRLLEVPVHAIAWQLCTPEDYATMIEIDRQLAEEFGEEIPGDLYQDGERRHQIVMDHQRAAAQGERLLPMVVCCEGDWRGGSRLEMLDGYHRGAGQLAAGVTRVRIYDLLDEDDQPIWERVDLLRTGDDAKD